MRIGTTLLRQPWLVLPIVLGVLGCGSKPAPVTPPPSDTAGPAAAPTTAPSAAASGAPAVSGEPSASPSSRPSSGRPAVTQESSSGKICSTFGSTPGSVLKLNIKEAKVPAVLEISEWSLPNGYNICWQTGKATPKKPVGPVFQLVVTEAREGEPHPERVDTNGAPFKFRMPLYGKKTVNLAIGDIAVNEETGKETVTWTVYAPTKVEEGLGEAVFELPSIFTAYVVATTAEPGAEPPPASKKK
jgi:hypothetical protein